MNDKVLNESTQHFFELFKDVQFNVEFSFWKRPNVQMGVGSFLDTLIRLIFLS